MGLSYHNYVISAMADRKIYHTSLRILTNHSISVISKFSLIHQLYSKNGYGDMVIMSIENYERAMKKLRMYQALETSERQIKEGSVKDARESLSAMRGKYGL